MFKLQFFFDFINIGNMFKSEWGVFEVLWQCNFFNYCGVNDVGELVYCLNIIGGIFEFLIEIYCIIINVFGNIWCLQIGVKVIF